MALWALVGTTVWCPVLPFTPGPPPALASSCESHLPLSPENGPVRRASHPSSSAPAMAGLRWAAVPVPGLGPLGLAPWQPQGVAGGGDPGVAAGRDAGLDWGGEAAWHSGPALGHGPGLCFPRGAPGLSGMPPALLSITPRQEQGSTAPVVKSAVLKGLLSLTFVIIPVQSFFMFSFNYFSLSSLPLFFPP